MTRNAPSHDADWVGLERRYAIRYSLSLPAEAMDLEKGKRCSGRTVDLSTSGCFIATNHPLPPRTRVRLRLAQGKESVEILAIVRAAKPGTGMGVEFIEIDAPQFALLQRWLAPLRQQ
ncbi:MAG TPA: PilZ domain-containing protein [Candidatus Acidoferrales bacterium]|nr:PilZ domain-containing protein [Candidatus Acidoferrales bacterium]